MSYRIAFFVMLGMVTLSGCNPDSVGPAPDPYAFVKPNNFPDPSYTFKNNNVSKEGFELGRLLFYDPVLSKDSTIACANCHQQSRAFSDPVHRFSKGVNDVSGFRNAPAIQNVAFEELFFWDGGVNHLDFVPINAITSELEQQETVANVVMKLSRNESYRVRFREAFGTDEVTSQRMLYALSQFMTLMISANSRYDRYIRGEGEQLTSKELSGLALFQSKCSSCHATDLFTDGSFRNNGLDLHSETDSGRQRITESEDDRGKFKVPSLRNVEMTSPYMHDGRFRTLENVIDHYRTGVRKAATLDPLLQHDDGVGITISDDEKDKLIAFLKTLTDRQFIQDKRFSAPM